jgi:hypothetical protein
VIIEIKRKLIAAFVRRFGKTDSGDLDFGSDEHQIWVINRYRKEFLSARILANGKLHVIAAFTKADPEPTAPQPAPIAAPAVARSLLSGSAVYVGDRLKRPAPFNPSILGVDLSEPEHVRYGDQAITFYGDTGYLSIMPVPRRSFKYEGAVTGRFKAR